MDIAALGFGITGILVGAVALWFAFMAHDRIDRADKRSEDCVTKEKDREGKR